MLVENNVPFKPKKDPLARPDHSPFIVTALRAVASGTADERQQKAAMEYVVRNIACTYDMAFRPSTNDRETNVALGKQLVGQTLVWLLNEADIKTDKDKAAIRKLGEQPDV